MERNDDELIEALKKVKETSVISFRVPLYVKVMYRRLPPDVKELVRDVIIGLITNGNTVNVEQKVINLNININKNEVKPTFNNTNSTDSEIAKEYVKTLEDDLRRTKEVIRRKGDEVKQLRRLLDKVRSLARAGDIRNIRKILGV